MDNHFYSSTEAAQITGCSRRQLQYWRDVGMVVPTVNPSGKGRNVYYSPSDLLALKVMEHSLALGLCFDLCAFVLKHLKKNEDWFFDKFSGQIDALGEKLYYSKQWMIVLDKDGEISHQIIDFDLDRAQAYLSKGCGVVSLLSDRLYDDLLRRLDEYPQETRFSTGSFAQTMTVRSTAEMDVDILAR